MSPAPRYLLAFAVPLVVVLVVTPVAGRLARRLGILDHPSEQKFHHDPTPYLGGAAVAAGLMAIGFLDDRHVRSGLRAPPRRTGPRRMGTAGRLGDRPSPREAPRGGVGGVALWFSDVRAGLFGNEVLDLALTVLWVVAVTNALNLLDNMDGLTAGVSTVAALAFFTIAAARGDYLVASFALAVAGASLGFLFHNLPPATIFLGDAGSLMLGFLLAALGLKLDLVGENGFVRSMVPVLILGVPPLRHDPRDRGPPARGQAGVPGGDGSLVPSALGPRPIERRCCRSHRVDRGDVAPLRSPCSMSVSVQRLRSRHAPASARSPCSSCCSGFGPRPRPDARQPTRPR